MKDFEDSWRNTGPSWGMYIQKCRPDELIMLNPKLYNLLMKYGSMFDDDWFYWLSKTGKWFRRIPMELAIDTKNAKAHKWYEKPKKYEHNMRLESF